MPIDITVSRHRFLVSSLGCIATLMILLSGCGLDDSNVDETKPGEASPVSFTIDLSYAEDSALTTQGVPYDPITNDSPVKSAKLRVFEGSISYEVIGSIDKGDTTGIRELFFDAEGSLVPESQAVEQLVRGNSGDDRAVVFLPNGEYTFFLDSRPYAVGLKSGIDITGEVDVSINLRSLINEVTFSAPDQVKPNQVFDVLLAVSAPGGDFLVPTSDFNIFMGSGDASEGFEVAKATLIGFSKLGARIAASCEDITVKTQVRGLGLQDGLIVPRTFETSIKIPVDAACVAVGVGSDIVPPFVSITRPESSKELEGSFTLEGESFDGQTGTNRIEIYDGPILLGEATIKTNTKPNTWSFEVSDSEPGPHTYTVLAIDNATNESRATVSLEISEAIGITLPPASSITLPVSVDLPDPIEGEVGADVVFNVDLSGSFGDDIATFRTQAAAIALALEESVADVRLGLTSFVDAPCQGYGSEASGDYGHRLDLSLTKDLNTFRNKLSSLRIYSGNNGDESQLESMYQTMLGTGYEVRQGTPCDFVADIHPGDVGWTDERLRFIFNSTDTGFHRPGDTSSGVPYPYPRSVKDVIDTAIATGTRISFLDSGGRTDSAKNEISLATQGGVYRLGTDSAEIVGAVRNAVETAITNVTVRLEPVGDDAEFVKSITPESFPNTDLTEVREVSFDVTFLNTVEPASEPQIFEFELVVTVDGAIIERRPVMLTVPPR